MMTTHPYDALVLENGSQLIFTPCPGTKEASLTEAVDTLKQAGADMLITLMSDEEMALNQVQTLPKVCKSQQITWLQLPIADDAAPGHEFEKPWHIAKNDIVKLIENSGAIAVHCKGGAGRTGLVIGMILLALGWEKDKVVKTVQGLRPNALVKRPQRDYFDSLN